MIDEKRLIEELQKDWEEATADWTLTHHDYDLATIDVCKNVMGIIKKMPKVGEWIPVSERLPSVKNKEFLVCKKSGVVMTCAWSKAGWNTVKKCSGTYDERFRFNNVIAWMPLPEPYKGEEE